LPSWLWPALVEAMVEAMVAGGWTVEQTRKQVQRFGETRLTRGGESSPPAGASTSTGHGFEARPPLPPADRGCGNDDPASSARSTKHGVDGGGVEALP